MMGKGSSLSLKTKVKFGVFSIIEKLTTNTDVNSQARLLYVPDQQPTHIDESEYLWVYCSTIGELNAVSILIDALLKTDSYKQLVLLTDHPHYLEAMIKAYPSSIIVDHGVNGMAIENYIDTYSPALLLIAEIPSIMFDAPCRLSSRVLYYCKKASAQIVVINGWLYNESTSSRIDKVEKSFMGPEMDSLIDKFIMQNQENANKLVIEGINDEKIYIAGNLKFDAVKMTTANTNFKNEILISNSRKVITCGCVTNVDDQQLIVSAFKKIKTSEPNALLVLAPRHPEREDRMKILKSIISDHKLCFRLRSEQKTPLSSEIDILIIDTMGELKDFYSIADICYVGVNHNVLEPLSFAKPTLITDGWDPQYPSYPVYQALKDSGAVYHIQHHNSDVICDAFLSMMKNNQINERIIFDCINSLKGSLEKQLSFIINT